MTLRAALPNAGWIEEVGPVDGIEQIAWAPGDPGPTHPIDVVVAEYLSTGDVIAAAARAPGVRLVQILSAGYDNVIPLLPEGVALANARGVHDASTAEMAVALALASLRGIPEHAKEQLRGNWLDNPFTASLADRRALIVGYGSIGHAIAERLRPFEVSVTAVASRPRSGDDVVDTVHGVGELTTLARDHDLLIIVTPLSDSTRGLIDAQVLAALPDGATVVNVGRGPVLDTSAVLAEAGRLRFALDVTDPEPLPPGHPLWSAPGVHVSPHVGGNTSAFRPRAVALVRRQLESLARGEGPVNLVHGTWAG